MTTATRSKGNVPGVDLSKPVVPQLFTMSHETYNKWINSPQLGRTSESLIFFGNPILERLSFTKWWFVPLYAFPLMAVCLNWSVPVIGWGATLKRALGGLVAWTFWEYVLHRFLFHGFEKVSVVAHFFLHGVHHITPQDPDRLVFPPIFIAIIGSGLMSIFRALVGPVMMWSWLAGVLFGYFIYDMVHFYTHFSKPNTVVGFLKNHRQYHMNHHFANHDIGFGVSSPFWDYVFNTVGKTSNKGPMRDGKKSS
jgi:sterol desaturase/sphingolipid hydroxylase (fatty acid hydroxylase superfamily)